MPESAKRLTRRAESAREILALNLVFLRRTKGWSQEALALEAGLHRTFVAHVERGARNASSDNMENLAHALGVDAYWLLVPASKRSEVGFPAG